MTSAERKRARRRAAEAALLGYRNRKWVHYTQGSARWVGISGKQNSARGEFPRYADCSAFSTWCLWNALYLLYRRRDVVNGAAWRAGFTGSQIAHGRRVSPSELLAGDLVFYARSGSVPSHVAICVGERDGRKMVVSHGSESGPLYLPFDYRRRVGARRYIHAGVSVLVLGASVVADVIALVIAISGLGSLVFAAMRWRRDDAAAVVQTQSVVVHDMETLTAGLRSALADCEERGRRPG